MADTNRHSEQFLATVTDLAELALRAGMAGDWQTAADAIQVLNYAAGDSGVIQGMLAWIDTCLAQGGYTEYGGSVGLKWKTVETGQIAGSPEEVPPAVRWAGRLYAARLADDQDTFESLINAIPMDPAQTGDYVMAVLQSTVLMIKRDTGL